MSMMEPSVGEKLQYRLRYGTDLMLVLSLISMAFPEQARYDGGCNVTSATGHRERLPSAKAEAVVDKVQNQSVVIPGQGRIRRRLHAVRGSPVSGSGDSPRKTWRPSICHTNSELDAAISTLRRSWQNTAIFPLLFAGW